MQPHKTIAPTKPKSPWARTKAGKGVKSEAIANIRVEVLEDSLEEKATPITNVAKILSNFRKKIKYKGV